MRTRIILAALAALLPIARGEACSYIHAPEPVGGPSATFFAGKMAAAASFVDLAVAERARPLRGPDGQVYGEAVTFRVIQRWKGNSPDRFTLFAQGRGPGEGAAEPAPTHWVDANGRVSPEPSPWEMPIPAPDSFTSCDPGFISPRIGRPYVVFREADGRLLGPVVFHPGERASRAFPFAPAGLPRNDPWTDAVFIAGFNAREAARAVSEQPAPLADRALIVLRRPLAPAAARMLLGRVGARPYAVQVAAGDFVDETRVPADWADHALFDRAVTAARENMAGAGAAALAREAVAAFAPDDYVGDGWRRVWVAALLEADARLARARKAGPPAVAAMEVLGDSDAWARLRRDPAVAGVLPGFMRRERPAAPTLPGRDTVGSPAALEAGRRETADSLLARLRALASGASIPAQIFEPEAAPPAN